MNRSEWTVGEANSKGQGGGVAASFRPDAAPFGLHPQRTVLDYLP
jgi:hypothetical protein